MCDDPDFPDHAYYRLQGEREFNKDSGDGSGPLLSRLRRKRQASRGTPQGSRIGGSASTTPLFFVALDELPSDFTTFVDRVLSRRRPPRKLLWYSVPPIFTRGGWSSSDFNIFRDRHRPRDVAEIKLPDDMNPERVVGIRNGLVCVSNSDSICICNPLTRQSVNIRKSGKPFVKEVLGFGSYTQGTSSSSVYKVVRLLVGRVDGYTYNNVSAEIITLQEGCSTQSFLPQWRHIPAESLSNLGLIAVHSHCIDDHIYFGVYLDRTASFLAAIVAFDLQIEKFYFISLPDTCRNIYRFYPVRQQHLFLGSLPDMQQKDRLCLMHGINVHGLEGRYPVNRWLLSKPDNVWFQEPDLVFDSNTVIWEPRSSHRYRYMPVCVWDNKIVLNGTDLFYFDLSDGNLFKAFPCFLPDAHLYVATLASIKGFTATV